MSHQHFFQMFSFIPQGFLWKYQHLAGIRRGRQLAHESIHVTATECKNRPVAVPAAEAHGGFRGCVCASYRVGECLLTVQQRQLSHTLHTERPEKMPHGSTLRQMSLKKNYTGFTECIKRVKAIYQDQLQPASPTPSGVMSLLCTSPRTLHNRACVTITTHQTRLKGNRTTSGKIPKGLLSYESRILPEKE